MGTKKATKRKKTGTVGGARDGAGRPTTFEEPMDTGIYIRCSQSQRDAVYDFVKKFSAAREKKGLPKIDFSTWAREILLKAAGRGDLGMAARLEARAKAAAL